MTDESIMDEVKNGDLQRASVLFDRYHKMLYNFFVKITLDRSIGHDLTQNVFLRMIKYRKSYKGRSFKSWIFQIARNVHADHYQKNKVYHKDHLDVETISEKLEEVDENLAKTDQEKLLHACIHRLNPEQREIIMLSKFQKMKYEDIAQIMECSVPAVKTKVHRTIKQLRQHYFELEKI